MSSISYVPKIPREYWREHQQFQTFMIRSIQEEARRLKFSTLDDPKEGISKAFSTLMDVAKVNFDEKENGFGSVKGRISKDTIVRNHDLWKDLK